MANLDITSELCPMTYVRTRIALDRLQIGNILLVRLRGDEPRRNVPRTAVEQGHSIESIEDHADGTTTVAIRRG